MRGEPGLYDTNSLYAGSGSGTFRVPFKGVYYCSAQIRMDGASGSGIYRLGLGIDGKMDSTNTGLSTVAGNKDSTNYRSMSVAGTAFLAANSTVSVQLTSSVDKSYTLSTESGFGCHLFRGRLGFHADKADSTEYGKGWSIVKNWSTKGSKLLYASPAKNGAPNPEGFYTASQDGYFACTAQIRLDSASSSGFFRTILALNGDTSKTKAFVSIDGNKGSTNYRTMRVAGTVRMKKGDTVAVFVYSSSDTSYKVTSESGFSCNNFGRDFSACKSKYRFFAVKNHRPLHRIMAP